MEEQLYFDIQRKLYYMIPEKWEKIALFSSVNKDMQGELFFYYIPKGIIKQEPVNCYEVPSLFDIQEDEYIDLLRELYNNIKILKRLYQKQYLKDWSTITMLITEDTKVILGYEDLEKSCFLPYEKHIIWRRIFLDIEPVSREDKNILERYNNVKDRDEYRYEVEILDVAKPEEDIKNMVNYERVLTADEVIARKVAEAKKLQRKERKAEKKNKSKNKNKNKNKKSKLRGKYRNILPDE